MRGEKKKQWKIIIVGAGASGMMAAISAARVLGNGKEILLLEKNETLGKKLLATGNGRCNYTNLGCVAEDLRSQGQQFSDGDFEKSKNLFSTGALSQLTVSDTKTLFFEMGILSRAEGDGRVYPYSGQGIVVKESLEAEIKRLGICLRCQSDVKNVKRNKKGFAVETKDGEYFDAFKIILATGGKAGLQYGSTGDGFLLARLLGHDIIKPIPALVQLLCDKKSYGGCKGVRAKGRVSLARGKEILATDIGEIQFTEEGISGICVFNISRYVRFETKEENSQECYYGVIDLFPEISSQKLFELLLEKQKREGSSTMDDFLKGLIHQKLAVALLKRLKISKEQCASMVDLEQIKALSLLLKNWRLSITGTKSWKEAQVTCGGVSTKEVDARTMESLLVPGLFFAGELIDIDGRCGGYNLQWAWSSGYGAGKEAAER